MTDGASIGGLHPESPIAAVLGIVDLTNQHEEFVKGFTLTGFGVGYLETWVSL